MCEVQTIYRVRIDLDFEESDEVENFAFAACPSVELESFQGCPACGPYLTAESGNRRSVEEFAAAVEAKRKELRRETPA